MSRTSFFNFIQGKTVLSVRARVFWSFAEFFCALGPYKTNGCRFKFQVVILWKLSIFRVPDFCYFPEPPLIGHHRQLRLVHCSWALFLIFVCLFVCLKKCTPFWDRVLLWIWLCPQPILLVWTDPWSLMCCVKCF